MEDKEFIYNSIKDLKVFSKLETSILKDISNLFVVENVNMGEPIFAGKASKNYIKLLIKGEVRQLVEHPSTNKLISLNIQRPFYIYHWNSQVTDDQGIETASIDSLFLKITKSKWKQITNKYPNIFEEFYKDIYPIDIWPFIKVNSNYEIPTKSKDLKKFINSLCRNCTSIVISSEKKKESYPKDQIEWIVAIGNEKLNYGETIDINDKNFLKKLSKKSIRLLGFPKELVSNYENQVNYKSEPETKTLINQEKDNSNELQFENKNKTDVKDNSGNPIHRYKFYPSPDDSIEESVACFRTIGDILDVPIKNDLIRKSLNENIKESPKVVKLPLFSAIAEAIGLKSQLLELPLSLLNRLKTPSVVRTKDSELFVLLENKNNKFLISRPRFGIKTYKINELEALASKESTFQILTLSTTSNTPQNKFGLKWFLPAIKKNRKPLIEVLVASLFVQIFQLMNPLIIQQIIDNVLGQGGVRTLPVLAILLFAFSIFENILTAVRTNLFIETTNRIDISLGEQVIDHLLRLPLSFFDKRPVGELSSRLGELEQIRSFLTSTALTVVLDAVFSIIYIAVMLLYSWVLTIVALLVAPLLALMTVSVSPIVRRQLRQKAELNAQTQNHLVEVITGIQTVKAQNFELKARFKWKNRYSKYITESFKNAVTSTTYNSINQFLNQASSLAVLCVGAYLVIVGRLTLGELIAFRIISGYVISPLLRLANLYQNFQQTNVSIERLSDIINTPQESSTKDASKIPMPKILGALQFENISFRFAEKGALNLSKVSLEIPKGKFVAVVGESGSGKSTLTKLIARLYEPLEGRILIDNVDISKVELNSLRNQIGVVPQDSILFDGTVQENISLTNPDAPIEDVVKAAEIACAHEFIMKLPTGYSSDVGERGSNLSGGQRQRIAIARSILQNPNLLIMDESTSALDFKTERKVSLNLMEFFRDKTVLFITHRLNSIVHADLIVTMHQGRVEEQGTHSELMTMRGRYYSLYKQQEKYEGD